MIVTIHQPDFLPWLGFFDRWKKSDLFIILDDVQFLRRGWQHRDKIKTSTGSKWLTVPVIKKGRYLQQIRKVEINNNENWRPAFLNNIQKAYCKTFNFKSHFDNIKKILSKKHNFLIDLNMDLLKYCANIFQIDTPFVFSSSFHINTTGTSRLVNLVKAVYGNSYLTGIGSKDYLDGKAFEKEGIELIWQHYNHPVYPQLYGDFTKMLSIIDFLMMVSKPQAFFPLKTPR